MKILSILIGVCLPCTAFALEITTFDTPYTALHVADKQLVGLTADGNAYELKIVKGRLETVPYTFVKSEPLPDDILSDGLVASGNNAIRYAWLGGPTSRYGHGVLADQIEASRLYAVDRHNAQQHIELGEQFVFEDRTPRLSDLDSDDQDELVVIQTNIHSGAAVASYGLVDGTLRLEAISDTIGLSHRWLNIIGIEDFNGDGKIEIAAVITPHIGGTLTLFQQRGNRLVPVLERYGFSNHENGSREQGMSAVHDFNRDGVPDMAVPDAQRKNLILLSTRGNDLEVLSTIANNARIKSDIVMADPDKDSDLELVYLLKDGKLVVVSPD